MRQQLFSFRRQAHPGKRLGRRKDPRSGVPHARRPSVSPHVPLHVTIKLRPGLPSLRTPAVHELILSVLREARGRFGLRINQYSIQSNHIHAIAEADDRVALSRGRKGLVVRLTRRLNPMWNRSGPVVAERFDARSLRTPTEVRNALRYVLRNAHHHGLPVGPIDPYSSARWFDGWDRPLDPPTAEPPLPVVPAGSLLQRELWRRHGPLRLMA